MSNPARIVLKEMSLHSLLYLKKKTTRKTGLKSQTRLPFSPTPTPGALSLTQLGMRMRNVLTFLKNLSTVLQFIVPKALKCKISKFVCGYNSGKSSNREKEITCSNPS